jgi:hypothetical protein
MRRTMMLIIKRKILVKKTVMAAVAVMVVKMVGLKLVLNAMMLPRRLTSPVEMLEHFAFAAACKSL